MAACGCHLPNTNILRFHKWDLTYQVVVWLKAHSLVFLQLTSRVSGILMVFPFMKYIPGDILRFTRIWENDVFIRQEHTTIIDEHRAALCLADEPTDFIDAYLKALVKEDGNSDSTFSGETDFQRPTSIISVLKNPHRVDKQQYYVFKNILTGIFLWNAVYMFRIIKERRKQRNASDIFCF